MAIKELVAVMRPPDHPVENGPVERWESAQADLGVRLPPDLRDFGLTYGSGKLVNLGLVVLNPFASDYITSVRWSLEGLQLAKDNETFKQNIFPENPGLFPWGWDENGADLCWLTDKAPERWRIALRSHGSTEFAMFDLSLTTFLTRLVTRAIRLPEFWPDESFEYPDVALFQPKRPGE